MKPTYINKKNKEIEVKISYHAYKRFRERFTKLFPDKNYTNEEISIELIKYFNKAKNIHKCKHLLKRSKKHGENTLYFENEPFRFVVENQTIITVEVFPTQIQHVNKNRKSIIYKIKSIKSFKPETFCECFVEYYDKRGNTFYQISVGYYFIPTHYNVLDIPLNPELDNLIKPKIKEHLYKYTNVDVVSIIIHYNGLMQQYVINNLFA